MLLLPLTSSENPSYQLPSAAAGAAGAVGCRVSQDGSDLGPEGVVPADRGAGVPAGHTRAWPDHAQGDQRRAGPADHRPGHGGRRVLEFHNRAGPHDRPPGQRHGEHPVCMGERRDPRGEVHHFHRSDVRARNCSSGCVAETDGCTVWIVCASGDLRWGASRGPGTDVAACVAPDAAEVYQRPPVPDHRIAGVPRV